MRRIVAFISLTAVALSLSPVAAAAAGTAGGLERVIVVLDDDVMRPGAVAGEVARRHNGRTGFVYRHALKGFSMELPAGAVAALRRDHRVRSVEYDRLARTTAQTVPTGIQRIYADDNANLDIDSADDLRIDVDVAVIDTGIDATHEDLNDVGGVNCTGGGPFSGSCKTGGYDDDNGHGTHVAGSVGAIDNGVGVVGVAPGARLWGVKVLRSDGSGYLSWITAGIDWVTSQADTIEVANMSLGCECTSSAMDTAIANSVNRGVTYVVAAGNSDADASTFSPANHPDAITVSALADFDGVRGGLAAPTCRSDQDDTLADFSNYGAQVEIAAPGVCILSAWHDGGYNTISGTSMASPHVAGAAALLASKSSTATKADTVAIRDTLVAEGTLDWVDDSGDGIHERLLDVSDALVFAPATVSGTASSGGDSDSAPIAAFTYDCTADLTCSFDGSSSTGSITSYSWDFGDTTTGTGATVSHAYATAGDYTVTLTVSDGTATDGESQTVQVRAILLSATGRKVKGLQAVDLTWSGATSTNVDVVRDGAIVTTTANDGAHTDKLNKKGGGSYVYKLCEGGTTTCSSERIVTF